jgi:hypothetical protein
MRSRKEEMPRASMSELPPRMKTGSAQNLRENVPVRTATWKIWKENE